ncbi:hypothetical protein CGZ75_13315 [Paenibacillus herberti]|uniref:Uncharacterized protein n=1 Tax=Paenibacillus herberti TaxID=1619309 RepID=A0A229NVU2_9BACL|nr:hypothetical protein [Paenibacillus herberti]OXM13980.1 hypothetical protein CGZ75_13315 [Paenibacillus herberti]
MTEDDLSCALFLTNNRPKKCLDWKTAHEEIDALKNIEVVKIVVDSEGDITSALSSTEGAIKERFQYVTQDTYEPPVEQKGFPTQFSKTISLFSSSPKKPAVKRTPSAFALLPNSNNPNGYKTGAFNRITTPANTSAYTGTFATSMILPEYNASVGQAADEAALMYTGIGDYTEAGFTTYSGSQGTGWFPYFRAEMPHIGTKTGTKPGFYIDTARKQTPGQVISSYKVYYKTSESVLKIRFLLGASVLYELTLTGQSTSNVRVKRVASIAMNNAPSPTSKFSTPYASYGKWFDFKFLKNDGAASVFPTDVSGLSNETWSHGGSIDYIKSGTNPVSESFKIY